MILPWKSLQNPYFFGLIRLILLRHVGLRHSGTDVEAGLLPPRLCGAAAGSCFWMGFFGWIEIVTFMESNGDYNP